MDECHSDSKDHRWFQNGWNRTFIIRECLKSCVVFFWVMWEGEIRAVAKNTHSYYMLSHPIRESLLYYSFNFSCERGSFKVWNYIENHTREFKSDSFDFEIARLISDHNVPQSVQLSLHTIPDTCYSYHSQGHVLREAALNDTGHLPQNLLPAVYSKFSAYSISLLALHFAATAACRESIHDTLAYGYSRNYVYPQTLERTCQQVCWIKCSVKCNSSYYFRLWQSYNGEKVIGTFYNYGCQSGRGPCETDECYATFYISKAFPQMLQIAQNAWTSLVTHGHWSGKVWMQSRLESLK